MVEQWKTSQGYTPRQTLILAASWGTLTVLQLIDIYFQGA